MALLNWLLMLAEPYKPLIALLSYVVSPVLTGFSFFLNRKDRKQLKSQSVEFGRLSQSLEEQQQRLNANKTELDKRKTHIERLENDLRRITEESNSLWKLRPPKPFTEFHDWVQLNRDGAKLITFGNLKGGVGKTTLAANFAAYLSETKQEPVLLIDLDYQGSLSNMLMLAIEAVEVESRIDRLFDEKANLATLERAKVHLVPKLNRGWLVTANYTFAEVENRLLLTWLLQQDGAIDVRYRLAHALLRPEIRQSYKAIIFDMPPRMTLGAVNALVASHYFVVPTVLDTLSVEAVDQFITNMKAIKTDLGLGIDLAGIVGMMSRTTKLNAVEQRAMAVAEGYGASWNESRNYCFDTIVPRRAAVGNAAGEDVAYFGMDSTGEPLKEAFDPLFDEMYRRIWG